MIRLKNVNKYYNKNKKNEIHVLNDISLEFDEIGFVTILGPSGSGKSTLLHVIGGLDKARGEIHFDNLSFGDEKKKVIDDFRSQNIGYIFQNYNLVNEYTVYQNLMVQLELIGIDDKEEIEKRINYCLNEVGMLKYKRRIVTSLSGGQQQRVAIARALVKGSKVIIADEPTGNLDSKNSIEVMNILKVLSKRCLVILVSHNKELADFYSDRIIKIADGKIIEDNITQNTNALKSNDSNVIYLDSLEKSGNEKIELYGESERVKLRLIVVDNTIYVENLTALDMRVVGLNTEKVILPMKPENTNISIETKETINFENKVNEHKTKKVLKNFFTSLRLSLFDFLFAKRRIWFMHFCFFFIGFFICFAIGSISHDLSIDEEEIYKNTQGHSISIDFANSSSGSFGTELSLDELETIMSDPTSHVKSLNDNTKQSLPFLYSPIPNKQLEIYVQTYIHSEYSIGKIYNLEKGEVIVSKFLADEILEITSLYNIDTYEKLVNQSFEILSVGGYFSFIIKDVIDINSELMITNDNDYFVYIAGMINPNQITKYYDSDIDYYDFGDVELNNLEMISEIKDDAINIYVSRSLYSISSFIDEYQYIYNIIGIYDADDFEIVFNSQEEYMSDDNYYYECYESFINHTKLLEGKYPEDFYEIAIPDSISGYNIGDYFNGNLIVGIFKSNWYNYNYIFTSKIEHYLVNSNYDPLFRKYEKVLFSSDDYEKTIEYFTSKGYDAYYTMDRVIDDAYKNNLSEQISNIISSIVLVGAMVLFIFFISRAKMLHQIYNIGVYRALGAKKTRLYRKFFTDGLVEALLTTFLGYTLMYILCGKVERLLNGFQFNFGLFILCALAIIIIMVFASLLPIILLMRKTPTEILVKYDI